MRKTIVVSLMVLGLGVAMAAAQAAPMARHDSGRHEAPIVQVRGGCGPGWHPVSWHDRWGRWHNRCEPNYPRWRHY